MTKYELQSELWFLASTTPVVKFDCSKIQIRLKISLVFTATRYNIWAKLGYRELCYYMNIILRMNLIQCKVYVASTPADSLYRQISLDR